MREIVTEFIGIMSAESIDRVKADQRQELDGDDIIDAVRAYGFGPSYVDVSEHGLYLLRNSNPKRTKASNKRPVNTTTADQVYYGNNGEEEDEFDDDEYVQLGR